MKNIYINEQIFWEFFNYQSPSFLVKDLYEGYQNKDETTITYLNESLINLRNSINSKKIVQNKNPKKVVIYVAKILEFNKQQKGKEI